MNIIKSEPVLTGAVFTAIAILVAEFTSFTPSQDNAIIGLALALGAVFGRSKVTPVSKS